MLRVAFECEENAGGGGAAMIATFFLAVFVILLAFDSVVTTFAICKTVSLRPRVEPVSAPVPVLTKSRGVNFSPR